MGKEINIFFISSIRSVFTLFDIIYNFIFFTMKKLLWLDDSRDPFDKDIDWIVFSPIGRDIEIIWVKSYYEFINWIKLNGLPDAICFDHDLGDDVEAKLIKKGINKKIARKKKQEEKTGYDCTKWLVEYCMDKNIDIPLYNIQSANPVGKENIDNLLKNFKKHFAV